MKVTFKMEGFEKVAMQNALSKLLKKLIENVNHRGLLFCQPHSSWPQFSISSTIFKTVNSHFWTDLWLKVESVLFLTVHVCRTKSKISKIWPYFERILTVQKLTGFIFADRKILLFALLFSLSPVSFSFFFRYETHKKCVWACIITCAN